MGDNDDLDCLWEIKQSVVIESQCMYFTSGSCEPRVLSYVCVCSAP